MRSTWVVMLLIVGAAALAGASAAFAGTVPS